MRSFMLAAAAALIATTSSAQEIGGRYEVKGTNFDGGAYGGFAEIEMAKGATCRMKWNTGSAQSGFCMRSGSTFVASYAFANGTQGLVIYEVAADGSMSGEWSVTTSTGVGTETLTPVR